MLVIDARKAYDAGIGTYVREMVPRVLQRLPGVDCTVLLAPGGEPWIAELQQRAGGRVAGQVMSARPLRVGEQWALRRALGAGQMFWATSLSHPLFRRGPMIATVHDVAQLALAPALAGGRLTKLAAGVYLQSLHLTARELMFVSEFTRQEFCRHVGALRQPSTVTPLGVNPSWFAARGTGHRPQESPYFVSVSSVRRHKNFAFLVRAFAAVADRLPHQLIIVGEFQDWRTVDRGLAECAAALGDRVRFLGRVPDAELRRWVAHADAMVFPSLYEGFGLPPLEALAAGCPVLCSTSGAPREVCGDAALYFDPVDEASLQRCLLAHAAVAPAERMRRIEHGSRRARTFDWEVTADLTAAALQRHLQPGRAR